MTREEIRDAVVRILGEIAPGTDPRSLGPTDELREALDIDSMDFLNFVTAVHEELRVEIPESDYAELRSLEACTDYLAARCGARRAAR